MGGAAAPIASMGQISLAEADFGARSFLLAIRNLAKTLRAVPGRKTLILFSAGFPLTAERQSELDATIDAANQANVAIYPVDVRGLQALPPVPARAAARRVSPRFAIPARTGIARFLGGCARTLAAAWRGRWWRDRGGEEVAVDRGWRWDRRRWRRDSRGWRWQFRRQAAVAVVVAAGGGTWRHQWWRHEGWRYLFGWRRN